ncbi:hypothetical protein [Rickettsia endosymbiont of Ceutorhynchus obstrictus]|uniref:hypothetical protein n=1 Tax=Rickettsia endosymbiont of Ceutorhynchus obstrictus TaxID=3066249 RepID=UPI003132F7D4
MPEQFIYSQKNNFSGGELTPTIEGRTELGLYQNGVKKLINFMLLPSGGIMRRHGTQFVHLFKDNVPRKIISIMFSRKLSYLLIFEAHRDKTTCSFFVGGELFLTSKTLLDNGQNFTFRIKDFSYCCFQGIAYISFGINRPIFKFSVDPAIVEKFYAHLGTQQQLSSSSGAVSSSLATAVNFPDKDKMFIIEPLKCHVNYYKQNNQAIQKPFNEVIYNAEIDKINDELKKLHTQSAANIYEQQQAQIYATHLVTFENRLWCFGVNKNIHSIWASYKGDFSDFRMAYKTLLEARNPLTAFSATFSSATFDNVLWSIPFSSELLLGTTDGIYLVKEGDRAKGEFIKIHKELDVPVSPIKPVIIGKTIFFVEGSGNKINSLYYSQEKGGFQLYDITAFAEHMFTSGIRQIVGINSPFSMVFAVLKDGSFNSFTYSQDLKIMGWTPQLLGGNNALVLSVAPIYGDNEDKLYFHVRRNDDIGVGTKEYLEALHPKYFTAKNNEMHKPIYADCHINISRPGEQLIDHTIMQALKDDSSVEFRGGITKLETIVQSQAANILKLNIDNIDIDNNFKYGNKLVRDYGVESEAIKTFLTKYYKEQMPAIMELLGVSFAFYRIFSKIYANLENVFSGEPASLAEAEQLLYEGEKLVGDIIQTINNIIQQNWQVPTSLSNNELIEYLPNSAFAFYPAICLKIKQLNLDSIKATLRLAKEIIKAAKTVINLQFEQEHELNELRRSVAKLNKKLLLYYANRDHDNKQELSVNIKKFFKQKTIGFYSELLNITHPTLTEYLFGSDIKKFITEHLTDIDQNTNEEQLKEKITAIVKQLLTKLEQGYGNRKFEEIVSDKRREEIYKLLQSIMLEKNLNEKNKEFLLNDQLSEIINEIVESYEFVEPIYGSERSDGSENAQSGDDEEEKISDEVYTFMQELKENLSNFQRSIIEYCGLIMPNNNAALLKNILEDENSIKLEKYLLLSKKYMPLFKKMFPRLGQHEIGVIAKHCLPSFQQVQLSGILQIYQNNLVAIIGDEELHGIKILDNELIKLKYPVRFLSLGFNYSSVLQTFPFIFPDEVEHAPKGSVEIGLKLFNTKGGYIEEKLPNGEINKQHINSSYLDTDNLIRFVNEKKYLATKEVTNVLARPYKSGWVNFVLNSGIQTDVDFTFVVNKPYPASILKIYAKAKILANYKGL